MIPRAAPFTAIVPMRAGSQGLKGKNLRPLAGLPLFMHSIAQARAAGADRIVISTDIASVVDAPPDGVAVVQRPDSLAQDDTPMAPVMVDAIARAQVQGTVVLLQPTSPLRTAQDIVAALSLFTGGAFELVMSVTAADASVLKWGTITAGRFLPIAHPAYCFANRQSLPAVFRPNGAIYVFDAQWFAARRAFETDRMGSLVMPAERSWDIDTEADFKRCEVLMSPEIQKTEGR